MARYASASSTQAVGSVGSHSATSFHISTASESLPFDACAAANFLGDRVAELTGVEGTEEGCGVGAEWRRQISSHISDSPLPVIQRLNSRFSSHCFNTECATAKFPKSMSLVFDSPAHVNIASKLVLMSPSSSSRLLNSTRPSRRQ